MTNVWIGWFYIFITQVNTNNIVMWEILLNNADWDCFRILILREIWKIQNPLLEEHCVFGSDTFAPISWMCKKQTAVSHSSIESEIISVDTGLRLDGSLALELWDLKLCVFLEEICRISGRHRKSHKIDVMKDIESVLSNVQSARQEALLYVFEDNEVVIEMILKGRSPTMRHASRNHRVVLDWLFDRIDLDSKTKSNTSTPKTQLTDILTKGESHTWCVESFVDFV